MSCNNYYISGENGRWFWMAVGGALVAALSVTAVAVATVLVLEVKS